MQIAPSEETSSPDRAFTADAAGPAEPASASGRALEPFLLFELRRAPSYGYELIGRLSQYGFRRALLHSTVVYKALRTLEETGAIRSAWLPQASGPARRYYELTDSGRQLLDRRLRQLRRQAERIERLLREAAAVGLTPAAALNANGGRPEDGRRSARLSREAPV